MGYGLVEFPKFLWTYGDNEDRAKQMQTRIALVRSSCKRQVLKTHGSRRWKIQAINDLDTTSINLTIAMSNALKTKEEIENKVGEKWTLTVDI